jgi:subtilase family serine protease
MCLVPVGVVYLDLQATAHAASFSRSFTVKPRYVYAGNAAPDALFKCQSEVQMKCYNPKQILSAYNIQPLLDSGLTGEGHTIVIVDAFQSPTIEHDLQVFNETFGLPAAPLKIIAPDGLTPFDPNDSTHVGWAGEISLDVEWAHAIAPKATIALVLAKSNQDADMFSALRYAIKHNVGDVISMSFSAPERCLNADGVNLWHKLFVEAARKGITLIAASGDQGAAHPSCDGSSYFLSVAYPASDPLVTAVGGTELRASYTGQYISEVAWNDPDVPGATGGGFSTIFAKPDYQKNIAGNSSARALPDVAYNAGIHTGVLAVWSSSGQGEDGVFIFGGTSAGAPQWAGITVLANQQAQKRLGFLNTALYNIAQSSAYAEVFHDMKAGGNTFTDKDSGGQLVAVKGYSARVGWDPATGWGSPNTAHLVPQLLQQFAAPARVQQ